MSLRSTLPLDPANLPVIGRASSDPRPARRRRRFPVPSFRPRWRPDPGPSLVRETPSAAGVTVAFPAGPGSGLWGR